VAAQFKAHGMLRGRDIEPLSMFVRVVL